MLGLSFCHLLIIFLLLLKCVFANVCFAKCVFLQIIGFAKCVFL